MKKKIMRKNKYCLKYLNSLEPIKEEEEQDEQEVKLYDEKMLAEDMNFISNPITNEPTTKSNKINKYFNCCQYFCCFICFNM